MARAHGSAEARTSPSKTIPACVWRSTPPQPSPAPNPESEAGRRELSRRVQLTLDSLPERYGQVLEWKYIEGVSVDEIARRLGSGYKAAESQLTRARQAFRDAFVLAGSRAWAAQRARGREGA